jgi:hypothetical protein
MFWPAHVHPLTVQFPYKTTTAQYTNGETIFKPSSLFSLLLNTRTPHSALQHARSRDQCGLVGEDKNAQVVRQGCRGLPALYIAIISLVFFHIGAGCGMQAINDTDERVTPLP